MDTLIRHHRMRGQRTKWILGTDHAGIATQTQVERLLERRGPAAASSGREAFEQRVWEWREEYGGTIIEQLKRLGASCDYADERFTLDEAYVEAVAAGVRRAVREGLHLPRPLHGQLGSGHRLGDLRPRGRGASSVEDTLYYIDYPLASGSGAITVATVRPETMLADTAIAVHPDDERYRRLIGETAILPLVGRELKIIADDYVKPEFGTGALKITPAHDPNDFEIGRRHGLAQISGDRRGRPDHGRGAGAVRGLTVAEAQQRGRRRAARAGPDRADRALRPRRSVLAALRRADRAARLAAVVHGDGRAGAARDRGRDERPDPLPPRALRAASTSTGWRTSGRGASRASCGGGTGCRSGTGDDETYVGTEAPEGEGWERDPDVLDTWFSSALWPFATLGWPDETPELRAFYPTDVLVTARDIVFLWVARMIMMGLEFTGEIPFSDVYVHAIIQAPDGRRMSKSLGTGIDPLDLIEGGPRPPVFAGRQATSRPTAPTRCAGACWRCRSGQDVRFSEDKIAQGQQLTNKLWNAARLILLGVGPRRAPPARRRRSRTAGSCRGWSARKAEVIDRIERYDFSHAALGAVRLRLRRAVRLVPRARQAAAARRRAASSPATLLHVLTETLALAHPMIPFVTEEIYSLHPGQPTGCWRPRVPAPSAAPVDERAEAAGRAR